MKSKRDFDILGILRIKHGALAAAARAVGSQTELAKRLSVSICDIGNWCGLKGCPPKEPTKTWPQERLDKLEADLFVLTKQTLDELFPDELRARCKRKNNSTVFERIIAVQRDQLLEYAGATTNRLTLPSPDTVLLDKESSEGVLPAIDSVLKSLSYREREIIKLRYGLGSDCSYTTEEVARIFKITRSRVHQIEMKAIRKLQCLSNTSQLIDFVE